MERSRPESWPKSGTHLSKGTSPGSFRNHGWVFLELDTVGPFLNEYISNRFGQVTQLNGILGYKHCSAEQFLLQKCQFEHSSCREGGRCTVPICTFMLV